MMSNSQSSSGTHSKLKSPTATTPLQRLPAPALFVGPPSRNASNLSVVRPPPPQSPTKTDTQNFSSTENSPASYIRTRARANTASSTTSSLSVARPANASNLPGVAPNVSSSTDPRNTNIRLKPRPSKKEINAAWADLQNTLADVELSAAGTRTHVFGSQHAEALRDLREAQIQLARAWGPGPGAEGTDGQERKAATAGGEKKGGEKEKDRQRTERQREEEEEQRGERDLSNAAARREANEKYFSQVKQRVQDVVGKLESVSEAMRRVEMESRDIWGEGESLASVPSASEQRPEG